MKKYLLDTHAIIWFIEDDPALPAHIKELLESAESDCYISICSLWEMAIKINIGKLEIKYSLEEIAAMLKSQHVNILSLSVATLDTYHQLPLLHKDPFDRILVAQAINTDITIITKDPFIKQYNILSTW